MQKPEKLISSPFARTSFRHLVGPEHRETRPRTRRAARTAVPTWSCWPSSNAAASNSWIRSGVSGTCRRRGADRGAVRSALVFCTGTWSGRTVWRRPHPWGRFKDQSTPPMTSLISGFSLCDVFAQPGATLIPHSHRSEGQFL